MPSQQQLPAKEQVLLFVSREGMNSFSVCAECKTVFRCPTCEKPLVYRAEGRLFLRAARELVVQRRRAPPADPSFSTSAPEPGASGGSRATYSGHRYDRKTPRKIYCLDSENSCREIRILITPPSAVCSNLRMGLARLSLVGIARCGRTSRASSWNADETAFRKGFPPAEDPEEQVAKNRLSDRFSFKRFTRKSQFFIPRHRRPRRDSSRHSRMNANSSSTPLSAHHYDYLPTRQ